MKGKNQRLRRPNTEPEAMGLRRPSENGADTSSARGRAAAGGQPSPAHREAEKGNGTFLDNVLDAIQHIPLTLDDMAEEEAEQGTDTPSSKTLLTDPPLPKRYFTGRDKALLEGFSQFATAALKKESRGDLRRTLLAVRKSYQDDCGGEANLTQAQRDLIDSICWLTLIEHLVGTSSLKFGVVKLNRSTGKIALQPVLEKNLVPLINTKRLLIRTLQEISRTTENRKLTMEFESYEGALERLTEMEMILYGKPITKLTLEQKTTG